MTTSKTTNKMALNYAIENLPDAPAEVREKWVKMVEQLDKKNASPKKMTSRQEGNEVLKDIIVDFLCDNANTGYTVSDLLKAIPSLEGDSNQHISALMRQLVDGGRVIKYAEKRKSYFKVEG